VGEALRTGNPNDYRIDGPSASRFIGRGEADEGPKGGIVYSKSLIVDDTTSCVNIQRISDETFLKSTIGRFG
jgi:hypothetical protein